MNLLQVIREAKGKTRRDIRIELGYASDAGVRQLETRPLSNMNLDTIMMFAHACDCDVELIIKDREGNLLVQGRVGTI